MRSALFRTAAPEPALASAGGRKPRILPQRHNTTPRPGDGARLLTEPVLRTVLGAYEGTGAPLSCERVAAGLLNAGHHVVTTRGRYFLKHYLDAETADAGTIVRQHRATLRLAEMGLPVAPPLARPDGGTVVTVAGERYALYPWVEGRHRHGTELGTGQSWRLGTLLGRVHTCLEEVHEPVRQPPAHPSADPGDTYTLIGELLRSARAGRPHSAFDRLAEHRLVERRALLERHAHRRPAAGSEPAAGWVHGDFHPLNLLYREDEPVAIVDWDRLGVRPRAEETVRAAAIFFVRPDDGQLDLARVRAYARGYRRTAGVPAPELAAAVHRVWWERLNDFWMLRWRYQRADRRADPLFPAASALAVWWTHEYEAVRDAFTD